MDEFVIPIDFIKETGVTVDELQYLIKHHHLDGYYDDFGTYHIKRYEIDYYKNYNETHQNPIIQN